ncbi:Uncharacterised protein [Mycobacteroides abscessus subsp. abscessus]|nr:Uncharacterised protein [Mycobacteroides abscessus subsp. abscessus]
MSPDRTNRSGIGHSVGRHAYVYQYLTSGVVTHYPSED